MSGVLPETEPLDSQMNSTGRRQRTWPAVLMLLLLVVAVWNLARWSRRRDWNQEHQLALASGALGFFILIWAPILELSGVAGGSPTRGTIIWAAIYLIFLIVLSRRAARLMPPIKAAAI